MGYEVVISNSKLNSYKTRVITLGIDIVQFMRNPLLLWMHNRPVKGTTDDILPIGTVENLRIEGDALLGNLKFDETDPFAMKIKAKWDAGILKMVSAGLEIIEQTDDPALLLSGQTRATVSKSILREVSVVDMGSNDDAMVLYSDGKILNLTAGEGGDILKPIKPRLNMKTIALKLGLPETATENEILAAIGGLQTSAGNSVKLQADMDALRDATIAGVVDQAIKLKRITADKRDHFIGLGKSTGVESLNQTLELIAPATKPTDMIGGKGGQAPVDYKKLSEVPAEKRMELRDSDRETYTALYKAEYGMEPVF